MSSNYKFLLWSFAVMGMAIFITVIYALLNGAENWVRCWICMQTFGASQNLCRGQTWHWCQWFAIPGVGYIVSDGGIAVRKINRKGDGHGRHDVVPTFAWRYQGNPHKPSHTEQPTSKATIEPGTSRIRRSTSSKGTVAAVCKQHATKALPVRTVASVIISLYIHAYCRKVVVRT